MSKLNIDQSSIKKLFEDKKSDFLIPDYQRPYAWGEEECQTLWDDIFEFAFPDDNKDKFNKDEEYYLGPIVTFKNSDNLSFTMRSTKEAHCRLESLSLVCPAN